MESDRGAFFEYRRCREISQKDKQNPIGTANIDRPGSEADEKEKCKSGESPKAARFISGSSRIPVPRRVSHAFASPVILYASCAANATSGNYAIRVRASLDSVYHLNGILRTARKFPIMSLLRGITLGVP